jgi:hypothetical protein
MNRITIARQLSACNAFCILNCTSFCLCPVTGTSVTRCAARTHCTVSGSRRCQYNYLTAGSSCTSTNPCDLRPGTCTGTSSTCQLTGRHNKNAADGTGCTLTPVKRFRNAFSSMTAAQRAQAQPGRHLMELAPITDEDMVSNVHVSTAHHAAASSPEASVEGSAERADEVSAATLRPPIQKYGICRKGKCVISPWWYCL